MKASAGEVLLPSWLANGMDRYQWPRRDPKKVVYFRRHVLVFNVYMHRYLRACAKESSQTPESLDKRNIRNPAKYFSLGSTHQQRSSEWVKMWRQLETPEQEPNIFKSAHHRRGWTNSLVTRTRQAVVQTSAWALPQIFHRGLQNMVRIRK